ncbi:MAG: hypothetical protein ACKVTZ_04225 [Bacteroidia bacterium]
MNVSATQAPQKAKTPNQILYENLLKICPYLSTMKTDSFVELVTKSGVAPSVTIGCKDESGIYEIVADYQGREQRVTFEVDTQKKAVETLIFQEKGAKTQIGEDISPKRLQALVTNLTMQGYQQKGMVRGHGLG